MWNCLRIGLAVGMLLLSASPAWAYCNKEEYFGITSGEPLFSTIDVVFSPFYSSTSTSGTSGCPNWNFAQLLNETRLQYVVQKHQQLLEEAAQGNGPHLTALGQLMGCDSKQLPQFKDVLHKNYATVSQDLAVLTPDKTVAPFLDHVKEWIAKTPSLHQTCHDPS